MLFACLPSIHASHLHYSINNKCNTPTHRHNKLTYTYRQCIHSTGVIKLYEIKINKQNKRNKYKTKRQQRTNAGDLYREEKSNRERERESENKSDRIQLKILLNLLALFFSFSLFFGIFVGVGATLCNAPIHRQPHTKQHEQMSLVQKQKKKERKNGRENIKNTKNTTGHKSFCLWLQLCGALYYYHVNVCVCMYGRVYLQSMHFHRQL